MNTNLGQMIFLTASVNELISNDTPVKESTMTSNCESIRFYLSGDESELVAKNPDDWIQFLKNNQVIGARLHFQENKKDNTPDRLMNGFVGGGSLWIIETPHGNNESICWIPKWNFIQKTEGNGSWQVSYHGWNDSSHPIVLNDDSLNELSESIKAALLFSKKNKLVNWKDHFTIAASLCSGTQNYDHNWLSQYIYENQLTDSQLQYLNAAFKSNVFGGMGSWNDLGFKSKRASKKYDEISERLYNSMCRAISELVSSTIPNNGS